MARPARYNRTKQIRIRVIGLLIFLLFAETVFAALQSRFDSEGNLFGGGTMAFTFTTDDITYEDLGESNRSASAAPITMSDVGTIDFQYQVRMASAAGVLCDALSLRGVKDNDELFNANLATLSTPILIGNFVDPETWEFQVSLDDEYQIDGQEGCTFELEFQGWQQNVASFDSGIGFTYVAAILNTITVGGLSTQRDSDEGENLNSEGSNRIETTPMSIPTSVDSGTVQPQDADQPPAVEPTEQSEEGTIDPAADTQSTNDTGTDETQSIEQPDATSETDNPDGPISSENSDTQTPTE